ncbi:hypothetical protein ScalyP_jg6625 [Parmales sp. scaly parma]|nr:hypothetical protein ScalyP_jg6625 [Parmales sp. scaly parma]
MPNPPSGFNTAYHTLSQNFRTFAIPPPPATAFLSGSVASFLKTLHLLIFDSYDLFKLHACGELNLSTTLTDADFLSEALRAISDVASSVSQTGWRRILTEKQVLTEGRFAVKKVEFLSLVARVIGWWKAEDQKRRTETPTKKKKPQSASQPQSQSVSLPKSYVKPAPPPPLKHVVAAVGLPPSPPRRFPIKTKVKPGSSNNVEQQFASLEKKMNRLVSTMTTRLEEKITNLEAKMQSFELRIGIVEDQNKTRLSTARKRREEEEEGISMQNVESDDFIRLALAPK